MADTSIPSVLWLTLWPPPGSDVIQHVLQVGGGLVQEAVLVSLFFDDATIADLKSSKGSGQWTVNQPCALIGSPFAADKKQPMQSTGSFLGLTHDLSDINNTGHVKFWARSRLHDKVRDIMSAARETGKFTHGTASKLYGIANVLEQGIYGRVGYGGLMEQQQF